MYSGMFFLESFDINNDKQFLQLVILFGELIGSNVFSHDKYLCSLIARDDLSPKILRKLDIMFQSSTTSNVKVSRR